MPNVLPVQLLPAARQIHPSDLGIMENKPPSQLSLMAIQLLQQKQMQNIITGMKFFGAGIGRTEDLLCFFLAGDYDTVIERHCPQAKEWLSHICWPVYLYHGTNTALVVLPFTSRTSIY